MTNEQIEAQLAMCAKYKVEPCAAPKHLKVGISRSAMENTISGEFPIYGLRYELVGDTTGWYIWSGEYSTDTDFYLPLCTIHLNERCPIVIPYLQLPPGWGFVIAPDYEDVWFDEKLVKPAAISKFHKAFRRFIFPRNRK